MKLRMIRAVSTAVVAALCVLPSVGQTDGAYVGKFKNVLRSLSNYRYGDISVFRVEGQLFADLQRYLNPPPVDKTGSIDKLMKKDQNLVDEIKRAVRRSQIYDKIIEALENAGYAPNDLADRDVQNVIQYYLDERQYQSELFTGGYLVTSKYQRGESGEDLVVVGFMKTRVKPAGNTVRDLRGVNPGDIITRYELTKLDPPPSSSKSYPDKMYGYLKDQVIQNNVTNVTLEAQGIDDPDTRFVRPVFGNAVQISEDDVQQFIKITNGIPVSYYGPNEITISAADLISYRRYRPDPSPRIVMRTEKDSAGNDVEVEQEVTTYNSRLPLYGVEMRYGLEDINYPSVWSERVAVNAVWSQARLGVILPTNGWSSLATSFGNARTMTNAGFGVNANVEVPIKIIAESGVFNFGASYVFDDATRTDHRRFDTTAGRSFDHLVRFHAQAQYTFAVKIDEYNLFRLRLGGTAYSMERWSDKDSVVGGETKQFFRKFDSEFIGGISGKVEFMNTSWSTPLGASLQYFDEAVLGNVWLQLQASDNLGFRIDANIFTPVFRDPRAWENNAVFMPSIRAILNF
jgi:hypothetical protein